MTALPIDYIPSPKIYEKIPEPEPIYLHNWLYSVIPVSERVDNVVNGQTQVDFPLFAYLTGYCKNCNTAFSKKIGADTYYGYYSETPMNIPKEGCVAPR